MLPSLDITSLHTAYHDEQLTPTQLVHNLHKKIIEKESDSVWISLFSIEKLEEFARIVESKGMENCPLYGVPFAIKDNINVLGLPTTAACPEYSYDPEDSAYVVQQLMQAGAIPIGKTNLDQFATGLVGVRSPYGIPVNSYHSDYIPGGSSSGSAVAVAEGYVTFALGTDTAGSGRIPASFNNLVGHKPTKGLLSCSGVVPACRSLDCVSIFTTNAQDAERVFSVTNSYDSTDCYARETRELAQPNWGNEFFFGVPRENQLEFFGNAEAQALFHSAVAKLEDLGGVARKIDFQPFGEAAKLLYEGPWVAERYVAIEEMITQKPDSLHPVTKSIIEGGAIPTAVEAFKAEYRLKALKRQADAVLAEVDFIVTPTAGTIYTVAEVAANPVELNSNLGYYTNFMNLLDYAATAIPTGFYENGMPFGVTAFAPAFYDRALLKLATRMSSTPAIETDATTPPEGLVPVVVCGAHLEGQPLNWQLTDRDGYLWKQERTAPLYEFYALPPVGDTIPPRPGVKRVTEGGVSIYVEVWLLPMKNFGSFVAAIPEPLGIGKVIMSDGETQYSGFICEGIGLENAENISHLADWREFVRG